MLIISANAEMHMPTRAFSTPRSMAMRICDREKNRHEHPVICKYGTAASTTAWSGVSRYKMGRVKKSDAMVSSSPIKSPARSAMAQSAGC